MTPGLFRNRILADPELAGVSAVLFDEVHERSLDGDFALALAIDAKQGLRDDLRLVAMSATLDGARLDRKGAARGKSVSERDDHGGQHITKTTTHIRKTTNKY